MTTGIFGRRLGLGGACLLALILSSVPAAWSKETVRVSMFSWPGYAFLQVAQAKGLVTDIDIEIKLIEDPTESYSLLGSGGLDATFSTSEFGPIAASTGMPVKLVGLTNFNCGMDKIIAHPDVKVPADVKGKKVAVMEGGLSQLFVAIWLEKNGMSYKDVEFVNLIMDDAAAAMIGGDVALGEFWAPYSYQVLENLKGSHVMADAAEEYWKSTALLSDAIFFSDDLIDNRRDAALALLKAYYDGKAYWLEHPDEAAAIIGEALKYSTEDVKAILGPQAKDCETGVFYAPFIVHAQVCGVAPGDPGNSMANGAIWDQWRLLNEWWVELGHVEKEIPPARGINCDLTRELYQGGYGGGPSPHY